MPVPDEDMMEQTTEEAVAKNEAPPKKLPKDADEHGDDHDNDKNLSKKEDEEDMKKMMKTMMGMMGKITTDIAAVSAGVEDAKTKAGEAVLVAKQTQAEVTNMKAEIVPKDQVQEMIDHSIKKMQTKIDEQLENIAKGKAVVKHETGDALFGGLDNATREDAEDWILRKLKEFNVAEPLKIFHKGDSFKGILYAKFSSPDAVTKAAIAFDARDHKLNGKTVWAKKDLPIQIRSPLSFLLGLRWQLLQWGFSRSEIKVDDTLRTLSVGGGSVVEVNVIDDKLDITWLDDTWLHWDDLHKAPEMIALIEAANTKLRKSAESRAKGKGKKGGAVTTSGH